MLSCEVVAVGTELLLGQIVDTNSAWIGEQLAASGIACHHQVKVGDNLARIVDALQLALERADAVIVCGGLGPTHDDITREAMAEVMGVSLLPDQAVAARIREMFAARKRAMPDNNLRQALVPVGATVIPQTRGTAPGLICPVGDRVAYLVPGVPHEMEEMVGRAVLPDLRRRSGDPSVIASRVLRTWGESESGLDQRLRPLIDGLNGSPGGVTLAFLASGWEGIKVRLTARAASAAAAAALLDPVEASVRAILGPIVFGVDEQTMESVVLDLLRARGLTLGLAESVTGGLVAGRLTDVPGASDVVRGSIVSYASEVKFSLLDVPEGPVVNEVTAMAMADGARRVLDASVGMGLTGVAGPAEQDGMPPGTLCVGLAIGSDVSAVTLRLPGQRRQMRQMSVISALDLLRRRLLTG
jgi:competence/damage-inducible protein CinA-like protein